eukprot:3305788-Amphidinium_carterae.1
MFNYCQRSQGLTTRWWTIGVLGNGFFKTAVEIMTRRSSDVSWFSHRTVNRSITSGGRGGPGSCAQQRRYGI